MKKQVMFSLAALLLTSSVFGQVEGDDMYFNSKDRAKLKAQTASAESYVASAKKTKKVEQVAAEEVVNPTDSYSARNVNPEFAARSNSQTAAADNGDYFVNNYKYNTSSNLNNWSNSYNSWAGPYYNSYNSWGNPWCNPYYGNVYASSFSPYWGGSWNYGWSSGIGMSYGYGNPYMNSWYGYPYYAYGYGSYAGGYLGTGYGYGGGYPGTVVIINNGGDNGRNVVYGKRASHGGMITSPQDASYTRTRTSYAGTTRPTDTGGRVATSGRTQRQEDYYNRTWRNSQQTDSNPSRNSSFGSWNNTSNRSTSDSYYRNDSNSSYSPSRSSSSFDGGGGATRQSSPASSGSNGRTRGRD